MKSSFPTTSTLSWDAINDVLKGTPPAAIVADIDYTVLDFAPGHDAGITVIGDCLGQDVACHVNRLFHCILNAKRQPPGVAQSDVLSIAKLHAELKKFFVPGEAVRMWSREAWILHACKHLQVPISVDRLVCASTIYWAKVTTHSSLYPDAPVFFAEAKRQAIPLIFMTASDSIMCVQNNFHLRYRWEHSRDSKRRRLQRLNSYCDEIVIGDPHDKPSSTFFDRVLQTVHEKCKGHPRNILFIGDSPASDLAIPYQLGYPTLHLQRM